MAFLLFPLSGSCQARLASIEQAIRLTTDVDSGCMVQEPIQQSHCQGAVGEDLSPLAEGLIGRDDDRPLCLIALVDGLKEE